MKKALSAILVAITILLSIFTLGFHFHLNLPGDPPVFMTPQTLTPALQNPEGNPLIDLNQADVSQLMSLPGIGEVFARRILDYRNEHGPFTSVADLLQVEGMGSTRLEAILDYITIGGQHEDFGS